MIRKKFVFLVLGSLLAAGILIGTAGKAGILSLLHWKVYDVLMMLEYRLKGPTAATKDIVFVVIDNKTHRNMDEAWPYPRAAFARVIENLKNAGARAIAFDFAFYGSSRKADDLLFEKALVNGGKVVLGAALDSDGTLSFSTAPGVAGHSSSGVVTKIQDPDSVIRRNLTYLVSEKNPGTGVFSWEMQVLKSVKGIGAPALAEKGSRVVFYNTEGEKWSVPVGQRDKSFLIHFRSRSKDFKKLSFYDLMKNDFDPEYIKNKIVLVGFFSSTFWDFYVTPIGWLPGITLNANAFLTLYQHDFLAEMPYAAEWLGAVCGVFLACALFRYHPWEKAIALSLAAVLLFFLASLFLMAAGHVWNYAVFPMAFFTGALLTKKLNKFIDILCRIWSNKNHTVSEEI